MAGDWTGPYAGVQLGYAWGDADTNSWSVPADPDYAFSITNFNVDGAAGGIYGGYMWQLGNDYLLGLEGEWNWVDATDTIVLYADGDPAYPYGADIDQKLDASLRLNVGKQMGNYMVYVTGGVAYSSTEVDGFTLWDDRTTHNEADLWGWTIGAGAEKKITANIHARIQYRFTDYGNETWDLGDEHDVDVGEIVHESHMLTVGVSYCF
jgi:outer membrane immunogenic protein